MLSIEILLRVAQQDVHVRVDALQGALVLGLAPLQADDELGADSVTAGQQGSQWRDGLESLGEALVVNGEGWVR